MRPIHARRPRGLIRSLLSVPAVALSLHFAAPTATAQWTQWGGANQDWKTDAKGLAASWPESGPKKLWSRTLGEGYSAILADAGRLYTMYRADGKESVVALDAKSGETVWEHKYESAPHETHVMQFGDGPRSTPLIAGDRLFAIGVAGRLHCLNKADGKVLWSKDLWGEMKGTVLNHGYSSSPVAYKDTVIVLVGGEEQAFVAFKQSDGSIAWKKQNFGNSYSTPKLINVDGEEQLVSFMATEIVGLDPSNGDLKWEYKHENQWKQNVCMPVWGPDNLLVFSSPEAGARALKLTRKDGKTEVTEAWSTPKIQFYHGNAIGVGEYVYGSTGGATGGPAFLAAVNAKTGKIAWRERGFAKATLLYADGRLLLLDEDGVLALVNASPEGLSVQTKAAVLEKVAWTVPTLVGKTVYLRDKKLIVALDLG